MTVISNHSAGLHQPCDWPSSADQADVLTQRKGSSISSAVQLALSSVLVGFSRVLRPTRHITGNSEDESFKSLVGLPTTENKETIKIASAHVTE